MSKAEEEFSAAFGHDWEERLGADTLIHFMASRFSLPSYFLGVPSGSFRLKRHPVL